MTAAKSTVYCRDFPEAKCCDSCHDELDYCDLCEGELKNGQYYRVCCTVHKYIKEKGLE